MGPLVIRLLNGVVELVFVGGQTGEKEEESGVSGWKGSVWEK